REERRLRALLGRQVDLAVPGRLAVASDKRVRIDGRLAEVLDVEPGSVLGGLDRDRAVLAQSGRGRDQLADDDVLLQADQVVGLALERRIGEHLGGLLERARREEALRRQRRLGDTEDEL